MHPTRHDLPEKTRAALCALLNERLADTIDLKLQAKQAHWNVKGPDFFQLHELFDKIADHAEEHSDLIAERITALGGTAEGTVAVVQQRSRLPKYPLEITRGLDHVNALATTLAAQAKAVRAAIDQSNELRDADTADLFTEISREVDKDLWFVEAHVQADR
jgi:starvation-inducible DNA-binding protein